MTNQPSTALAVPAFESLSEQEARELATLHIKLGLQRADEARQAIRSGSQSVWLAGKAAIHIRDNILKMEDLDLWEAWAKENINEDYLHVGWAMKCARDNPNGPREKVAVNGKQLLIFSGDEVVPKETPRKEDTLKFKNMLASVGCIRRWWRGGDAVNGLDNDLIRELSRELATIVPIAQALHMMAMNLED